MRHEIQNGERRERGFRGIQQVEVTTSAWFFNPEQAFAITDRLNQSRPKEKWVGIEVYPTTPGIFKVARALRAKGLSNLVPPKITPEQVREWQRQYPNTRVSRIHLEFSFDPFETYLHRPLVGESGAMQRVYQIAWAFFFGPATSQRGVRLAETLGVGVNAHPNVIEGFAKRGQLEDIKRRVAFVLAENERPYNSPHLQRLGSYGISSHRFASDPEVIKWQIVQRYGLDGLLLGVDHAIQTWQDSVRALDKTSDVVRAIHLAGAKKGEKETGAHRLIKVGDPQIERFLEAASRRTFKHEVSVALDYNPFVFKAMLMEDQLELVRNTIRWIEDSQRR